jgi:hypothetical protein
LLSPVSTATPYAHKHWRSSFAALTRNCRNIEGTPAGDKSRCPKILIKRVASRLNYKPNRENKSILEIYILDTASVASRVLYIASAFVAMEMAQGKAAIASYSLFGRNNQIIE